MEFLEKARNKQTNNNKKKPMIKRKSKHKYKAKVRRTARNISIILFLCSPILPHSQPPSLIRPLSQHPTVLSRSSTELAQSRQLGNRQTEEALKFRGPEEHGVTRNTDTSEPQDSSKLDSFKSRHLNFM